MLRVNGVDYGGWKAVRVTRGIETISGSFELSVSEKWEAESKPWPIREGDECQILIDNVPVITGYVDKRSVSISGGDHIVSVSGRDKTGDLVDCSADLSKWEFNKTPVLELAKKIARPFGISVSLQSGVDAGAAPSKVSIDPGDSAFEAIEKACRPAALLPVSDGQGGLLLTRAGASRATTELVLGQNILDCSADFDSSGRFQTYKVLAQAKGSDEVNGASASSVKATAQDMTVKRSARVLVVRAEGSMTTAQATKRAQWEATVRAARSDSVSVTVQGWQQGDGKLWPINAFVRLRAPALEIDADLLITQITHTLDESGTITQLSLKRPDAFKPQPEIAKTSNHWKEIVKGV